MSSFDVKSGSMANDSRLSAKVGKSHIGNDLLDCFITIPYKYNLLLGSHKVHAHYTLA